MRDPISLRHPVQYTLSPLSLSHRLRHRHTIGNTPQYTVSSLRFLASTPSLPSLFHTDSETDTPSSFCKRALELVALWWKMTCHLWSLSLSRRLVHRHTIVLMPRHTSPPLLFRTDTFRSSLFLVCCSVLQCAGVCCSVLPCAAVCCSV